MNRMQKITLLKLILFDIALSLITLALLYGDFHLVRLMRANYIFMGGPIYLGYFMQYFHYLILMIMLAIFFRISRRLLIEEAFSKKWIKLNAVIFLALNTIVFFIAIRLYPNSIYYIEVGNQLMLFVIAVFVSSFILLPFFPSKRAQ